MVLNKPEVFISGKGIETVEGLKAIDTVTSVKGFKLWSLRHWEALT